MSKIPLCKPQIGPEELKAVEEVLLSGWLTHGPKTTEFEESFASYLGVKHAVAMNSCTSALFLAVLAQGITGDVLVPSFTFVASANAIVTAGANPVFVDIAYHDCNVDADKLEQYVTPRTEAIMIVHYAGQCCDMDKIMAFAEKHGLAVIEDSAETIGGTYKGLKSGSWGTGCYSFFPTKNITTGEGGMLTTNDDRLARDVRTLIAHGIDKSTFERTSQGNSWARAARLPGYNFRLSNILAVIGVEQMKKIDSMNSARRELSFRLMEKLSGLKGIDLPVENPDCEHVFQMFTIKVKNGGRDKFVKNLNELGVGASVHFSPPAHQHPAYAEHLKDDLPVTEQVAESIVTLPMFPLLTEADVDMMADAVAKCLA